jgi:hypothetical protein
LAKALTDEMMINRANNPMESWNAVFNSYFSHSPIMTQFIAVILNCSQEKYDDLIRIQRGQMNRKIRDPPSFPELPPEYASFDPVPVVVVPALLAPAVVALAVPPMVAASALAIALPAPAVPASDLLAPGMIAPLSPFVEAVAREAMAAPLMVAAPAMIVMPAPEMRAAVQGAAGGQACHHNATGAFVHAGNGHAVGALHHAIAAPDLRPYTEFIQDPALYCDGSNSEEENDMQNEHPNIVMPAASSHKRQKKEGQSVPAKKKESKKRAPSATSSAVNISVDFKPKSYRNPR